MPEDLRRFDLDGDGFIRANDVNYVGNRVGEYRGSARYDPRCDFNNSGSITSADLSLIQKYVGQAVEDISKYDLDGDGDVSGADLSIFRRAIGSGVGSPNWNPACDFDGDGRVSGIDFSSFIKYLGRNVATGSFSIKRMREGVSE